MENYQQVKHTKYLAKLNEIMEDLPLAEKKIAELILSNKQAMMSMTIHELAKKSETSYSTVVRFINKLGASGYKEFKVMLYEELLYDNSTDLLDVIAITQGATIETVCNNTHALYNNIISETMENVEHTEIELAARLITKAKKVCFIGTGLSGITAKYAYSRFFRIGITCLYQEDVTFSNMTTALLEPGDVLFAVSSSGRTKQVIQAAQKVKERGVDIIALSDYKESHLFNVAQVCLSTTNRHSNDFLEIDMPLLVGQIFLIDMLYMRCCVNLGQEASSNFVRTKNSMTEDKFKHITNVSN